MMFVAAAYPHRPMALSPRLRRGVALLVAISLLILPLPGLGAAEAPVQEPQAVMGVDHGGHHHHAGHETADGEMHHAACSDGVCGDAVCGGDCGLCHLLISMVPELSGTTVRSALRGALQLPLPVRYPDRLEEPPRT